MKKFLLRTILAALVSGMMVPASSMADESKVLSFAKGKSEANIKGSVKGSDVVDYLVSARAGQTMIVDFKAGKGAAYFNVMPPNSSYETVFSGAESGNHYQGQLTQDGKWIVRIYLMGAAKDSGKPVKFTLKVSIPPNKESANTAVSNGTVAAEKACLAEVAKTTNVEAAKLSIADVIESQAGITVMIKVPDATALWSCKSGQSGKVYGVTFTGSEGAL